MLYCPAPGLSRSVSRRKPTRDRGSDSDHRSPCPFLLTTRAGRSDLTCRLEITSFRFGGWRSSRGVSGRMRKGSGRLGRAPRCLILIDGQYLSASITLVAGKVVMATPERNDTEAAQNRVVDLDMDSGIATLDSVGTGVDLDRDTGVLTLDSVGAGLACWRGGKTGGPWHRVRNLLHRAALGCWRQAGSQTWDNSANDTHVSRRGNPKGHFRKLEGVAASVDSTLLPDNQRVYREDGGGSIWDEGSAPSSSCNAAHKESKTTTRRRGIVPSVTLDPDEYMTAEFKLPKKGTVELDLDATHPVKTYIVGPKSLQRFEEGSRTFKYWGGFPDPRARQHHTFVVPFSGPVFLLIVNPNKTEAVDVDYEMSF